jgi:hypothetical protein
MLRSRTGQLLRQLSVPLPEGLFGKVEEDAALAEVPPDEYVSYIVESFYADRNARKRGLKSSVPHDTRNGSDFDNTPV